MRIRSMPYSYLVILVGAVLIIFQPAAAQPEIGPPSPVISIRPVGVASEIVIKLESSMPVIDEYSNFIYIYRCDHPYGFLDMDIDSVQDTIGTLDLSDPYDTRFIDRNSGLGDTLYNYCYFARAVWIVDSVSPTVYYFSAPSNIVCEWDFPLYFTSGTTHWNQISIPLWDQSVDTFHRWLEHNPAISEVDEWDPITQSFRPIAVKQNEGWSFGGNRATSFLHPYFITGDSLNGSFSIYGNRMSDDCDYLYSNSVLDDLNNVSIKPAWHWFFDGASTSFRDFGRRLTGTPDWDNGVREILEWSSDSQTFVTRSRWDGSDWTEAAGVSVFKQYFLRRFNDEVRSGYTVNPLCWPPLLR